MQNETVTPVWKETVPVFFATDDNYAPYLGVAIRSLVECAAPDVFYDINLLIDRLSEDNIKRLSCLARDNVKISFVRVSDKLDRLGHMLHLRDYYTRATYFRFFIPALFPQYDKGLYLDCDIVLCRDAAELFHTPLGDKMLAAAPEEVMLKYDIFGRYTEAVLEIDRHAYFSAGVMVMNLEKMRKVSLEEQFVDILGRRKFPVTQDQDYLNVLCRGDFVMLSAEWNTTSFPDATLKKPALVHYKINWKPWHYRGTAYEDRFWDVATRTPYYLTLCEILEGHTEGDRLRERREFESLVALAESEIAAVTEHVTVHV